MMKRCNGKRVIRSATLLCSIALLTACSSAETGSAGDTASSTENTDEATADESVNATVIWRAFDDQFQSGFRIIMQDEAQKLGGINLDMQDAANDVSTANSKLEVALSKGTDVVAICAPDRESIENMMVKCEADNVPAVFFNMEPKEETMKNHENIWYIGAKAEQSGEMCAQALINYWNENKELADKKIGRAHV